ncbi:hypothetical protein CPB84DRAFT_1843980 [Gymnopilus junonius]|uniref:Nicotinamide-nucleotide adenylyltransferase n=1 Tax=Gymnopilus junonius TaxID=109634 RepID=A0A9P5NW14_GYMJU|nr:hypothetical protein CPB84DRAFT_1843980 [Gymnopilus junonius]
MKTISNDGLNSETQPMVHIIRQSAPALLQRVQQGLEKFQLIHAPHPTWPLPHSHVVSQYNSRRPLRISILDSSFNPPTLAHLALANSPRSEGLSISEEANHADPPFYDAKLLLLSVKNVDKSLKPGDATYQQRLEMMSLLTLAIQPDVDATSSSSPISDIFIPERANVAIGITDEPTFVGKANTLIDFLKTRLSSSNAPVQVSVPQDIELTFLVGMDTLERLFAPRYYTSEEAMMSSLRKFFSQPPAGDNSRIVCARRVVEAPTSSELQALSFAKEFVDSGRIAIIDLKVTRVPTARQPCDVLAVFQVRSMIVRGASGLQMISRNILSSTASTKRQSNVLILPSSQAFFYNPT